MAETIDPPVALPPASHGKKITIAGVFAVVIAAGVVGGVSLRTNSATITNIQPAAYPLSAHYEQVNGLQTAVCDRSSAQAWPDSMGGVNVQVSVPSPATVNVWMAGNNFDSGSVIHLTQQVNKRGVGANFWARIGSSTDWIRVSASNKHDIGTCSVLPDRR